MLSGDDWELIKLALNEELIALSPSVLLVYRWNYRTMRVVTYSRLFHLATYVIVLVSQLTSEYFYLRHCTHKPKWEMKGWPT